MTAASLARELRDYVAAEKKILRRRAGVTAVTFDAAGNPRTRQGRGGRPY